MATHRELIVKKAVAQQTTERFQAVQTIALETATGYQVSRHYTGDVSARRVTELSFETQSKA
ncbi:MAG: hypothetical protein P1V97_38490 [Planctomycetota bacterium]|nr:hypothetical protein [Planctomycetota bacterium]